MGSSLLDKKMSEDRRLEPFTFFRNNALDIVKLAAGENEELAQASRNLVYLSFEKWGWTLLRNLEREA